ncbi:MAG: hypothetical protein AB1641_20520 [Thermodesulfobacteriota bacterium]
MPQQGSRRPAPSSRNPGDGPAGLGENRPGAGWACLVAGLIVYLIVQGALANVPLRTRALPPEVDDALGYLVKTRQMTECFFQDCPALEDLRPQLLVPSPDRRTAEERYLAASRVFPVYHFLYSALLLGLTGFGLDLLAAHNLVWSLGPLLFGLAFGYLLVVLWGRPAAGLGLLFLAFKVYPGTGLNLVQPSNLALGLAMIVWARVISRRGDAPWTLTLGVLGLAAMHPVGLLYSVLAMTLAFTLRESRSSPMLWLPAALILGIMVLYLAGPSLLDRPYLFRSPAFPDDRPLWLFLSSALAESIAEIVASLVRLEEGLFGWPPVFLGAVVLGFLAVSSEKRQVAVRVTIVYVCFLFVLIFYGPTQPADAFLRAWIPLPAMLFGAVGAAAWRLLDSSRKYLREWDWGFVSADRGLSRAWPLIALAVLVGYSAQMMARGGEQVAAMIEHLQKSQPLSLDPAQPARLLAEARAGDRVLYTSMILMPYYFLHGALRLGAVYYHPTLQDTATETQWLARDDLRFAVVYHPTVYHPSFNDVSEHNWWITPPEFHFSPLSRPRTKGPLSREGFIPASDFKWIEVVCREPPPTGVVRLWIRNPGRASNIGLGPPQSPGSVQDRRPEARLPARWSGWMDLKLDPGWAGRFKLVLPDGRPDFMIGGLVFDRTGLLWPWEQKAELTFQPRDCPSESITISFDPARLVPDQLRRHRITVLNDRGSSVLLRLDR